MGQKTHPIGFRLGIYRTWDSRWFARTSYADQVMEDRAIRKYLTKALVGAELSHIEIEKAGENIKIIVHVGRPGIVIGKKGQEIEFLRKDLARLLKRENVEISVQEVKTPELDAAIAAQSIAEQLERRASYKKVMKKAALSALRAGAKGINICCAGRLAGAEIARTEWLRLGSVPRHTLRANIDYALKEAKTTYGIIGVKVWIYKGDFKQGS